MVFDDRRVNLHCWPGLGGGPKRSEDCRRVQRSESEILLSTCRTFSEGLGKEGVFPSSGSFSNTKNS